MSWQGGGRAGSHQRGGRQLLKRQLRRAWHRARSLARLARRARRAGRAPRRRRSRRLPLLRLRARLTELLRLRRGAVHAPSGTAQRLGLGPGLGLGTRGLGVWGLGSQRYALYHVF